MPAKRKAKNRFSSLWILTILIILTLAIGTSLLNFAFASKNNRNSEISNIKPDSPGTYRGNLPCADCPGIKETLTLTALNSAQTQGSYLMEDLYLERDPNPQIIKGSVISSIPC